MNLMVYPRTILAAGSPACSVGAVSSDMLLQLRLHGLSSPARGLDDPRLQYPELLLVDGWERQSPAPDCAFSYRYSADTAAESPTPWQQTYACMKDGSRVLTTQCGSTENIIRQDTDGQVTATYRPL